MQVRKYTSQPKQISINLKLVITNHAVFQYFQVNNRTVQFNSKQNRSPQYTFRSPVESIS